MHMLLETIVQKEPSRGAGRQKLSKTWCRECVERPCCISSVAALARVRAPEVAGVRKADQAPLIPQARRVRGLPAVLLDADLR